jgi:predicted DCC family thiol-disulfide oxidoreductase YuxK
MSSAPTSTPEPATAVPAIIYFDGVCGICNWGVDFVMRRDRRRQFRFTSLQGQTSAERLNLPPEQLLKTIVLEDETGRHQKSSAVWRILVRLGGMWAMLGRLLQVIPRPLRNWGYDLVSRNRYSLFGKKDVCRIPTPEERALFLP